MITKKIIDEYFYVREDGLYWKKQPNQRIKINSKSGYSRLDGYKKVSIKRKTYYEHQLIFFYHHGYFPKEIDHVNGNPSDNRIENLREVTHSQNLANSQKKKKGSSKFKGVCWIKPDKIWMASITVNKQHIHLGRFKTEKEAAIAYNKKADELFNKFAKLNKIEE